MSDHERGRVGQFPSRLPAGSITCTFRPDQALRWDGGIESGSASGPVLRPNARQAHRLGRGSRAGSNAKARRALVDLIILGVETSRDFHVRVMDDDEFRRGDIDIPQWLERRLASILGRRAAGETLRSRQSLRHCLPSAIVVREMSFSRFSDSSPPQAAPHRQRVMEAGRAARSAPRLMAVVSVSMSRCRRWRWRGPEGRARASSFPVRHRVTSLRRRSLEGDIRARVAGYDRDAVINPN